MITSQILKTVILEQRERFLDLTGAIARNLPAGIALKDLLHLKEIIILTGVRRCGKSYLMRLIWQAIKDSLQIASENFLYLNFEDERLLHFSAADFDRLLEAYHELTTVNKQECTYCFFDEIQEIEGWDKFLSRLRENKKYKIFVTGSNATLLSKEISSRLTGRNVQLSFYPLSFQEFLRYQMAQSPAANSLLSPQGRAQIKGCFQRYLEIGGFPEVIIQNYRSLLQEYLKNIIYRDIVLRYRIRSALNLREIVSFVLSNIGAPMSLEKITKMTRMRNVSTVKNYLGHLANAFLLFPIAKYSFSVKKQIYNPDKYYVIDSGLYNEVTFRISDNIGHLLENAVLLELKRKYSDVFYHQDTKECDFIVHHNSKVQFAIQVTRTLTESNRTREIDGLVEALRTYNLKEGLILTEDETEDLNIEGMSVRVRPIWQWCFEEQLQTEILAASSR